VPVAVPVDAIADDVFGQHLDHPDLARPRPRGRPRIDVAAAVEFQRREDLRLEEVRPPAVVTQRHERVHRVEVALHRPVVRLERPEGEEDAGAHPVVALHPVEDRSVALGVPPAVVDPVLADQPPGEVGERPLEDALRAVGADHGRVLPHARKELPRQRRIKAPLHRLALHRRDEGAEVAAAGHGR
jgi:hypothetical protein